MLVKATESLLQRVLERNEPLASHTSFETQFADFIGGGARAFAFWKGRIALYAILKALEIGPGDEVLLPAFTCVVVPNAVRFVGATPIYVDLPPEGYNLSPDDLLGRVTPRTKAILVQHTFGLPAAPPDIRQLPAKQQIYLIEDCAHALGVRVDGRHVGTLGHAGFFSSQWSKPFTTGLGGLAVTRHPEIAQRLAEVQDSFMLPKPEAIRRLRTQLLIYRRVYSPRLYWMAMRILRTFGALGLFVPSSSRRDLAGKLPPDHEWLMTTFQERAGIEQLAELNGGIAHRRSLAAFYDQGLAPAGWPALQPPSEAVLLRYPLRVGNKPELLAAARAARVELGSWFESPLHPLPLEKHAAFGCRLADCPNAARAARQVVNLPTHPLVSREEAARILDFVLERARRP